jgi:hypothetical protein
MVHTPPPKPEPPKNITIDESFDIGFVGYLICGGLILGLMIATMFAFGFI